MASSFPPPPTPLGMDERLLSPKRLWFTTVRYLVLHAQHCQPYRYGDALLYDRRTDFAERHQDAANGHRARYFAALLFTNARQRLAPRRNSDGV